MAGKPGKRKSRTTARPDKHVGEEQAAKYPTVPTSMPIGATVDVSEDALVQAIQMVILKRSRLLAEEVAQSALEALRALDSPVLTAVIRGTERAGMKGYASSSRHKMGPVRGTPKKK